MSFKGADAAYSDVLHDLIDSAMRNEMAARWAFSEREATDVAIDIAATFGEHGASKLPTMFLVVKTGPNGSQHIATEGP